jgi:hypothetical protein
LTTIAAGARIAVHCDACGRDWRVPASLAGHHGKCACGHVLIVPHPDAPPGTVKCPHCGKWTRPEGWCEWCSAPLETLEPVHLPSLHEDELDGADGVTEAPGAWRVAGVVFLGLFGVVSLVAGGGRLIDPGFYRHAMTVIVLMTLVAVVGYAVHRRAGQLLAALLCLVSLASGLVVDLNKWLDNSPGAVILPDIIRRNYAGGNADIESPVHFLKTIDVRGWRPGLPDTVRLDLTYGEAILLDSGRIEVVERRGAFGLAWIQAVRRAPLPDTPGIRPHHPSPYTR